MSKSQAATRALLLTSALIAPTMAHAQATVPINPQLIASAAPVGQSGGPAAPGDPTPKAPQDVSIPGGSSEIVITGQRDQVRSSTEVSSLLSVSDC